jgi:hypothetical protein
MGVKAQDATGGRISSADFGARRIEQKTGMNALIQKRLFKKHQKTPHRRPVLSRPNRRRALRAVAGRGLAAP